MLVVFLAYLAVYAEGITFNVDDPSKTWAVIIAGSSGFQNYRHQSDVCHAYHQLRGHGIPADRIITLMYNDIAYNEQNSYPGLIFNGPSHDDVYEGVRIDYQGDEVTPEAFMKVLRGNKILKENGFKVLESTNEDNVFVYFADHGAPGMLGFPFSTLSARSLNKTIAFMHKSKMYKNLVIYIEACYSGSMFDDILPNNIGVYAVTAANPDQSSYAIWTDSTVPNYLADEFSYAWIYDAQTHDLTKRTLEQQFGAVKYLVQRSDVSRYGDMSIAESKAIEFEGQPSATDAQNDYEWNLNETHESQKTSENYNTHVRQLELRLETVKSEEERSEIQTTLDIIFQLSRSAAKSMEKIVELVHTSSDLNIRSDKTKNEKLACYEDASERFMNNCHSLQEVPEVSHYLLALWNMCHRGIDSELILKAVKQVCY